MAGCPVKSEKWLAHYDHFDSELNANPYPVWATMREHCPIVHSDQHGGFWVLSRYEDTARIARDTDTFSSRKAMIPVDVFAEELPPVTLDPPRHTQYRRLLLPLLTAAQAEKWEAATWDIADRLIDGFVDREQIDIAEDYAKNIPIGVMSRILGVDENDRDSFSDWVARIGDSGGTDAEDVRAASTSMAEYLWTKLQDRRRTPQDDLLTFLVQAEIDGEPLSDTEVLATGRVLLFAGIDTVYNTTGMTLQYLATHPADRHRLAAAVDEPDDELWALAIEEFLRAFAPASMPRYVTKDTHLRGQRLREADMVLLLPGAANRDPEVFDQPEEVIIDRRINRHITFGIGPHRCLGAHLARMELRVGLKAFLRRIPDFAIAEGEAITYGGGHVRGPRYVPLVISQPRGVGASR
jgi:cytochrome P450